MATESTPSTPCPDLFPSAQASELVSLAKGLYPHLGLGDGPYSRTVSRIINQAAEDASLWRILHDGLRDLRLTATRPILDMDSQAVNCLLHDIEHSTFFTSLRPLVAFHLYDDREVWEFIGYPGASFDHGGYLNHGFNDLKWLPEPRIVESTEPLTQIGPLSHSSPETNEYARTLG